MADGVLMFRGAVRQKLPPPKLFRPERVAEAIAEVLEGAAPHGRLAYTLKRFKKLSPNDARRACEGRASRAIQDAMFKEGGWGFVLEVFALFFDRGVEQHFAEEAHRHARNAERFHALAGKNRSFASGVARDSVAEADQSDRGLRSTSRRVGKLQAQRSD